MRDLTEQAAVVSRMAEVIQERIGTSRRAQGCLGLTASGPDFPNVENLREQRGGVLGGVVREIGPAGRPFGAVVARERGAR